MNSDMNDVISAFNRMNSTQKRAFLNEIRQLHRKNLRSARNKRYYQRHKEKILAKQKLKNEIYANFVKSS